MLILSLHLKEKKYSKQTGASLSALDRNYVCELCIRAYGPTSSEAA